jgi:hypothetical protein
MKSITIGDWFVPSIPGALILEYIVKVGTIKIEYISYHFSFHSSSLSRGTKKEKLIVYQSAMQMGGRKHAGKRDFERMIQCIFSAKEIE